MRMPSIRLWLCLAVLLLFTAPAFAAVAVIQAQLLQRNGTSSPPLSIDEIIAQADHWREHTWQVTVRSKLQSSGESILILDASNHLIYTSDTHRLWAVSLPSSSSFQAQMVSTHSGQVAVVQANHRYLGTLILSNEQPPNATADLRWMVAFSVILALLPTLAIIAWFIRSALLKPLAAMSQAARNIAANNLDFHLPRSPAREVAQVIEAFVLMGNALHTAIGRQAELEQERRLFISAIAHDLRTPLFSLRGYLEALQTGVAKTPEQIARYLTLSQKKANALERLIGDLFTYSQLEYLEIAPHQEQVKLGLLLQKIVDSWRPRAKEVHLVAQGPANICLCRGDEHLLTRAVENLLDNALHYTPPGGTVSVRWFQQQESICFTVTDTGPGIAPRDIPHLFTPLYRGEASRNRQTGGVGLGLTIARRILQAHAGGLTATNAPLGGAQFRGNIPCWREEHACQAESMPGPFSSSARNQASEEENGA